MIIKTLFYQVGYLKKKQKTLYELSDLIFAPYINSTDFIDSIPNKIIDAISYGKPILTSLKGEVYDLLNYLQNRILLSIWRRYLRNY